MGINCRTNAEMGTHIEYIYLSIWRIATAGVISTPNDKGYGTATMANIDPIFHVYAQDRLRDLVDFT